MAPSSQKLEPPAIPGRFIPPFGDALGKLGKITIKQRERLRHRNISGGRLCIGLCARRYFACQLPNSMHPIRKNIPRLEETGKGTKAK